MALEEISAPTKNVALKLFEGLAKSYDRTLDAATLLQDRYWKSWIVQRAGPGQGKLLLDVGSGTLVLEERLAGMGYSVVGVDLTKKMIELGRAKGLDNVALLVNGDAEALPFCDGVFDVVASCYVPKYVSLHKFARELGRIVKPGGTVAAYDFVKPRGAFSPFVEVYVQGVLRIVGSLLRLANKESAYTFQNLPGIVEGAQWDRSMTSVMEASGFKTRAFQRLSGGVICAYWGEKLPSKLELEVLRNHAPGPKRK